MTRIPIPGAGRRPRGPPAEKAEYARPEDSRSENPRPEPQAPWKTRRSNHAICFPQDVLKYYPIVTNLVSDQNNSIVLLPAESWPRARDSLHPFDYRRFAQPWNPRSAEAPENWQPWRCQLVTWTPSECRPRPIVAPPDCSEPCEPVDPGAYPCSRRIAASTSSLSEPGSFLTCASRSRNLASAPALSPPISSRLAWMNSCPLWWSSLSGPSSSHR